LNQKGSCYSTTKLEEEFKEKERLMRSLSEFPEFYEGGVSSPGTQHGHKEYLQYKLPEINGKIKNKTLTSCKHLSFKRLVSSNLAKKSSMVNYSEAGRESDDLMSNKKGKKVTRIHEEMLIKITNNKSLSNPNAK
jgi:hypothetical protein